MQNDKDAIDLKKNSRPKIIICQNERCPFNSFNCCTGNMPRFDKDGKCEVWLIFERDISLEKKGE